MNAQSSVARRARAWSIVGRVLVLAGSGAGVAQGQILQAGDIVIGGARVVDQVGTSVGRIYRYRDGVVDTVFDGGTTPGLGPIGRLFIDSQARIVFTTVGCGNANSAALWRVDLATGIAEQLACFPYVATPATIPPGLPSEASSFYFLASLYPTKSLRITIDDDVNGGVPQVGYDEAYGCTIGVTISAQTNPMAFRYVPTRSEFEDDVSLSLLAPSGGVPQAIVNGSQIIYANGYQIGRAQSSAVLDFTFDGDLGSVSGHLVVSGPNGLLMSGDILDNTLIPNITVNCGNITDDNVPELGFAFAVLSGIENLGFAGGGMFVTSTSGAAGRPYLFNLARRGPFLNPYNCQSYNAVQYDGPIEFYQGADPSVAIADGGRVLATRTATGELIAVQTSGSFQVLASDLVRPAGVAVYPPPGDAQTARNLTLRIDEPVGNVLLADPDGHQLGHAADGSEVNDFGDRARLLSPGQPGSTTRVYTLSEPAAGEWHVQMAGSDAGAYTLRAYLADTSAGGTNAFASGTAQAGVLDRYRLVVTPPLGLTLTPVPSNGDVDDDGDVDLADFGVFLACFNGPQNPPAQASCAPTDFDHDNDVDLGDFGMFLSCFNGPQRPPACAP